MSLVKQLWIGILTLLIVVLSGNFVISMLTAKTYLQEQLRLKNIDNANSLALSISQLPDKDPVTLELMITAQFDAGHYEYIIFHDLNKQPIVAREFDQAIEKHSKISPVPAWFAQRVTFDVPPGVAQVQDGWQQMGSVLVKSHSRFAVEALWKNMRDLLDWFVVTALLSGLFGSVILKHISRPLNNVITQAEAISERRFIVSPVPKTRELQRVVQAMNTLSNNVKAMLEKETRQLEFLRRESQTDALTSLINRKHFLNILDVQLAHESAAKRGLLVILRLLSIHDLNKQLGHHHVDHLLCTVASVFSDAENKFANSYAARLNGSDFCLLIANDEPADLVAAEISQTLNFQLLGNGFENVAAPLALCSFFQGEKLGQVLHKLDGALAQAELKGNRAVVIHAELRDYPNRNLDEWRTSIKAALAEGQIQLAQFPVQNSQGELMHWETAVRLKFGDHYQPAGYFMPWAVRLGLMAEIDLTVVRMAVKQLETGAENVSVNISALSLCNTFFREKVLELLHERAEFARQLWIEFPEVCVLRHLEELRAFVMRLHTLGCYLGLEHVGLEFTQFGKLQDMGLHYLKLDAAVCRGIDANPSGQSFIQSLSTLAHSMGLQLIAEGVMTESEKVALIKMGLDGFTGPHIQ